MKKNIIKLENENHELKMDISTEIARQLAEQRNLEVNKSLDDKIRDYNQIK